VDRAIGKVTVSRDPERRNLNEVRFVFCIHNHQPVGNLPGVFEDAYKRAYLPMLEAIESFPDIKVVVHNSGPLLEWYEEHAPEYIDRLRALAVAGQAELLSGGFYEPILSSIPERDALGQIAMMTSYVSDRFQTTPRGMWLAERVWEPTLPGTIGRAGVEYVPLDDYEFRLAGLEDADLVGSFMTDDRGVGVRVFPISKKLRYSIPFAEPSETIDLLRGLSERDRDLVAVFGDDGEKFGVWPGTHHHVYAGGWLRRFFCTLMENRDWLRTSTFAEVCDEVPPRGRVYLPTSSYPEMMEWALPTPARRAFEDFRARIHDDGLDEELGPFVSGGTWRGFFAKYEESNLMLRKMLRVSDKVARAERAAAYASGAGELTDCFLAQDVSLEAPETGTIEAARRELWRGQCNCAYWHGIFGGLYLPHLRSAVYEHLIRGERHLDEAREDAWDDLEVLDHDMDGRDEVVLESDKANVYVAPARGGAIFELDVRDADWNLLATMSRYEEAYHRDMPDVEASSAEIESGAGAPDPSEEGGASPVRSIHGGLSVKEAGLRHLASGDGHPRWAAVDHLLDPDLAAQALDWRKREWTAIERGDFAWSPYEYEAARREGAVGASMFRKGRFASGSTSMDVVLRKSVWLSSDGGVSVEYEIEAEEQTELVLASEWSLAFLTGEPEWVFLGVGDTERLDVRKTRVIDDLARAVFTDRLRGRRLVIECEPSASLWTRPLQTASQSEAGLERVFQGLGLVAAWPVATGGGDRPRFAVRIRSVSEF
jgi:alpha-amylase